MRFAFWTAIVLLLASANAGAAYQCSRYFEPNSQNCDDYGACNSYAGCNEAWNNCVTWGMCPSWGASYEPEISACGCNFSCAVCPEPLPSCQLDGTWCNTASECCSYICGDSSRTCGQPTPIMINLKDASLNYHLTDAAGGVSFDINADGISEQISWTEGNSEIAILAMDRNGNHTIDDGSELFGNSTPMTDGAPAANGFEALIDLDGGALDSDGQIRSIDAAYGKLLVWLDRNHNGVSEPSELQTLDQAGIKIIFTDYRESARVDRNGNAYKFVSEAVVQKDKNGRASLRKIFDVYLTAGPPPPSLSASPRPQGADPRAGNGPW